MVDSETSSRARRLLRIGATASLIFWAVFQIVMIVLMWDKAQYSDAANYAEFARQAWQQGSIYPTFVNFTYDRWVANTGYINFLVANLAVFGTLRFVALWQLLFNVLLLWSLWKLTCRYAGRTAGACAVIVFCLLPSNAMVVPAYMSDLMCCSLLLCSVVLMRRNYKWLIAAALLAVLANWVRPVGLLFWPALLAYALYERVPFRYYVPYILTIVAGTAAIGAATYASCGYPLTGSTTKGTNMIMGCNDAATGNYDDSVFLPGGAGYIEPERNYNTVQTDSALTRRSIDWILANPGRFLALVPKKMVRLWAGDYYADKTLFAPDEGYDNKSGDDRRRHALVQAAMSLTYYLALILAVIGFVGAVRRRWLPACIFALPLLLGCGMHILMYGGLRYHYPMMPVIEFFAAVGLCILFRLPWSAFGQEINIKNGADE